VFSQGQSSSVFETPTDSFSYLVWVDSGTYYAKNGLTGAIDFYGSAALTVIQSAINTLTWGGTIFLLKGTYELDDALGLVFNSLALEGEGNATVLKVKASKQVNAIQGFNSRLSISNLKIDGNKANNVAGGDLTKQNGIYFSGASQSHIENVFVENCIYDGIFVSATTEAQSISIENCISNNNDRSGIEFNNITFSKISGSNVQSNGWQGIRIVENSYFVRVIDNQARENGVYGIYVEGVGNNFITANLVWGNYQHGVCLYSSSGNEVTDNIICDNDLGLTSTYDGIRLMGASWYNVLDGNYVSVNHAWGIKEVDTANNNTLVGNDCHLNGIGGMKIIGSGTKVFASWNNTIFIKFYNSTVLETG
jgi:parallel beta-helix repeat protein